MDNKFYCEICEISFLTWSTAKKHFQSKKHKDRQSMGRVELFLEKFAKHFKRTTDESGRI